MKDAVATMGGILPADAGGRDAVHVAVFSAVSEERLQAGQHIGIVSQDGPDIQVSAHRLPVEGTVAIVDPFIRGSVRPGQRFWAYLYPRTITALSHRWSHPALEETANVYVTPANKLASEEWLRNFCAYHDCPDYDSVMRGVALVADQTYTTEAYQQYSKNGDIGIAYDGEYLTFVGEDAHCEVPDEFWMHAENVLGRPIKGRKPSYFSCTC